MRYVMGKKYLIINKFIFLSNVGYDQIQNFHQGVILNESVLCLGCLA